MAPIMPLWFSMTTIRIYRKTQRIKKKTSYGLKISKKTTLELARKYNYRYNQSNIRLLIIIFILIFKNSSACKKKVVSDSLGLVDFATGLVKSVFNLPDGQVLFFEEFE